MPFGPSVRRALGRWEPVAARVYRARFIDLDVLAITVAAAAPAAKRILEIGCGDGAMATALRRVLPDSEFLGLDPNAPSPGRLYEGTSDCVEFRRISAAQLITEQPEPFDLVTLCDVLHHVAEREREQVLREAAQLTAPSGTVAVKEWERRPGMANLVACYSDRWLSGDAGVRFMPRPELQGMIARALPGWITACEARIPPRRANLLLMLRRP